MFVLYSLQGSQIPGHLASSIYVNSVNFYCCCSVRFEDVHRLGDGQVKHSTEVFYAGSLWKVHGREFIVIVI